MKKMITVAALLAIGAGAGGYWYSQQEQQAASTSVLNYVPADTALFSAQLKPFPVKSYIDAVSNNMNMLPADTFSEADVTDPRGKFFVALFESYNGAMKDGQTFINTFGLAEEMRSYFYMLGAVPVVKVELAKPEAIWAWLDAAEQKSGLSHSIKNLKGVDYRSYQLNDPGEQTEAELVVAVTDNMLTITLGTNIVEAEILENALGLKPVAAPINATPVIEEAIARHGFTEDGVGIFNHQEIAKALTTKDGNLLAKHLSKLAELSGEPGLTELQTPACEQELAAITANWPRTVMGFDSLEVDSQHASLNARMVVESNNSVLLKAYQSMSGFIPDYAAKTDNAVFSMAFGIDVNQLVPSLMTVWDEMLEPRYQCQPLQDIQTAMSHQSPGMMGMMTGMANGVKGIGLAVFDYQLGDNTQQAELKSLDAMLTLSADNPKALFDMAKQFSPALASINLPADGTPVDLSQALPIPPYLPLEPKIALKGEHLVLFNGERAASESDKLAGEAVESNGLMSMYFDYEQMFAPIVTGLEMSGEEVPQELLDLKDYRLKAQMNMKVLEQGISFGSSMSSDKATN